MKKSVKLILFIVITVTATAVSSCQEESVQPAHEVGSPRDAASGLATGR